MLTYYWPSQPLELPPWAPPICIFRWCLVVQSKVGHPIASHPTESLASVSGVCSYLTVKAFIIIRLNLKTFSAGVIMLIMLCENKLHFFSPSRVLAPLFCWLVVLFPLLANYVDDR